MWSSRAFYFGLGVATPFLLRQLRPLAKVVIKGGLVAAGRTQKLVAEARENLEDLAAEASEEVAAREVVVNAEVVTDADASCAAAEPVPAN